MRPFRNLFRGDSQIGNDSLLDRLEESLLLADVGPALCDAVLDRIRQRSRRESPKTEFPEFLRAALMEELEAALFTPGARDSTPKLPERPWVILLVGSPGVGKTTTIGKLAYRYRQEGRRVLMAGTDTHRAAAGEQSAVWADRIGVDLVTQKEGADAAAVVHDALRAALARSSDLVLVDTAGRLYGDRNPMEDLRKLYRVIGKVVPGAPQESFLVLDATTGQNGLQQAREFNRAVAVDGIVLTKLDGTARGGIALAIQRDLGIPIRFLGVGEEAEDLVEFRPRDFLEAMMGSSEETGIDGREASH